jgi:hypothetical protein
MSALRSHGRRGLRSPGDLSWREVIGPRRPVPVEQETVVVGHACSGGEYGKARALDQEARDRDLDVADRLARREP